MRMDGPRAKIDDREAAKLLGARKLTIQGPGCVVVLVVGLGSASIPVTALGVVKRATASETGGLPSSDPSS